MDRNKNYDVYDVPHKSIFVDSDFNCRGEFTSDSCHDLANSIRENGLAIPIIVQPMDEAVGKFPLGFDWRLVAGHRRYRAVALLKWETIPAQIKRGMNDEAARMLNFTENLERSDLNILQEARWLAGQHHGTIEALALKISKPKNWVHIRLRLLKLPDQIQQMAAAGMLTASNLEAICRKETKYHQLKLAKQFVAARSNKQFHILGYERLGVEQPEPWRRKKNISQINDMIAWMFEHGISGLATQMGAWCCGNIPDEEFKRACFSEKSCK